MKLEARRSQITQRLETFKADVKTMILEGKTIPSTYNELITELENNRTNIDQESRKQHQTARPDLHI